MLMTQPDAATQEALITVLRATGLYQQLGPEQRFAPANWHQSLSTDYTDSESQRALLRRAGDRVLAQAFAMQINRVTSSAGSRGTQWELRPIGKPPGFVELHKTLRLALAAEGLITGGNTPHLTISYWAPHALEASVPLVPPVRWAVRDFVLVRGGGSPYRYEVLHRWKLAGEPEPQKPNPAAAQMGLF